MTRFAAHAEGTGVRNDDRPKWLAARRTMLTASDMAAVLGEDPYRSPLEVYADKIIETEPEALTIESPAFWGLALETPILRTVATYYGWQFEPGGELLRSRKHPHLGATLDAEIDRNDGLEFIPLEGKTTRLMGEWDEDSGDLPTRVLIQVQQHLLVTQAPIALVFALLQGSRPVRIEIHPSPTFHEVIVEESERFMERVRRLDAPPPDHSESSRKALFRLHPQDSGAGVMLPADAAGWTRAIKDINAQVKDLERHKAEFQNLLRAAIGSATYGILPAAHDDGQRAWKLGLEERPEHTVSASSSRVLRAIKNVPSVPIVTAVGELAPPANDRSLEDLLRRSSFGDEATDPMPKRRRRQARR